MSCETNWDRALCKGLCGRSASGPDGYCRKCWEPIRVYLVGIHAHLAEVEARQRRAEMREAA